MKRLLMVAAVSVTLGAGADYVWINETDTTYDWGAAWDHNGVHEWPTQAPSENVTIAKPVTVTYTTGFDFEPQAGTVFTLSGGAKFVQKSDISNWPWIKGKFVIDGGMADFTAPTTFRVGNGGEVEIKNGGELKCQTFSFYEQATGKLTLGEDGRLTATSIAEVSNATIEIAGGAMDFTGDFPAVKNFVITGGSVSFMGNFIPSVDYKLEGGTISFPENEFQPLSGTVIDGAEIICKLFAPQAAGSVIKFKRGSIVTKNAENDGFYPTGACLDFIEGAEASWTFTGSASRAYEATFGTAKFTYAGAHLTEEEFGAFFDVIDNLDGTVTIKTKLLNSWALATPKVSRVGSTATISGKVLGVDGTEGKLVYVCGLDPNVVNNLRAGTVYKSGIAVEAYQIEIPNLEANKVYYYAVGILAGGHIVDARSGVFLSSDDMVGFLGSASDKASNPANWQGIESVSTATLNGKNVFILAPCRWDVNFDSNDENQLASLTVALSNDATLTIAYGLRMTGDFVVKSGSVVCEVPSVYVTFAQLLVQDGRYRHNGDLNLAEAHVAVEAGEFTTYGEVIVDGTPMSNAVLSASVFKFGGEGYQPIQGTATRFVTTIATPGTEILPARWSEVPFGTFGTGLLNLIPGTVANNIIPTASGFQFRYDDEAWPARTDVEIHTGLFAENRIQYNGETLDYATFANTFRIINDETAKTQLVTTWNELGAEATGTWTMRDGAVVKLTGTVKLDGLTIKGSHSILDLDGHTLRVPAGAFRVGTETIAAGEYTAAQIAAAGWSVKVIDSVGTGKIRVVDSRLGFSVIIR